MQEDKVEANEAAVSRVRTGLAITFELIVAVEVMFLLRWLALMEQV